jgi:hypothetical protein
MYGAPYDFNKCPIAPLGIKVVAHIPPEERASWAHHGIFGFYVGPAPEHYRCYQIYIPSTKGIRISDCLEWFPEDICTTNIDAKLAALPLISPTMTTDYGKQRVPVPTTISTSSTGKQRVPTSTIQLHVDNKNQLKTPKRQRLTNQYVDLTVKEINKLSKNMVNKINMRFIDENDPNDVVSGKIIEIVKHKKSKKLQYKYYDDSQYDEPPCNKDAYSYINAKYCLDKCKFQKIKTLIASTAQRIENETNQYNSCASLSKTQRKNRTNRQRPRLEWYQKLNKTANFATKVDYN